MIDAAVEPKRIALQERDLLTVARAVVGHGTPLAVEPILMSAVALDRVGPSAMALLEDTLSKGVVKMLARLGGSRPRLRPNAGSSRPTRVFEARPTPTLAFGPYSFELLRWLTREPLDTPAVATLATTPRTIGDHLLAYLTLRLVSGGRRERVVLREAGVMASPLAWLGYASLFGRVEASTMPPSFDELVALEEARLVIECLADDLTERWTTASVASGTTMAPAEAHRTAILEHATINGFLDAVQALGRWDLATFLVDAGVRLCAGKASARELAARTLSPLDPSAPLRLRSEARKHSGAVFHGLARIGAQHERLGLVRFFDDGYDDAQCLLASWERFGREGFARALEVVRALATFEASGGTDESHGHQAGDKEEE